MQSAFTIWAPGRVNFIGEDTDYSGRLVMPAAIHLGAATIVGWGLSAMCQSGVVS
ncbi:MAG: galactokinase family protein [Gaiellaceae bacterium]